jgi:hypothetical protein
VYRPITANAAAVDKDFIKQIKANHFDIAGKSSDPRLYVSVSMHNFNHKGDASSIKARLDEAKKQDLRQCHFKVGGESYNMISQMKSSYRPLTAQNTVLNKEKKSELRASHWGVGEKQTSQVGGSNPFVTHNMMNFRWVQPRSIPI